MENKDNVKVVREGEHFLIYKPSFTFKEEKTKFLNEISKNCEFFKNIELPHDLNIEILEIKDRIIVPYDPRFFYILKEGNIFLWLGKKGESAKHFIEEERITENDEHITINELKEGKIVEILDEGEVFYSCSSVANIPCLSPLWDPAWAIAGLPRKGEIETVKMIRISMKELADAILQKKKFCDVVFRNIAKILHNKLFVESRLLASARVNKAPYQILSILYLSFIGYLPLCWYKIADGDVIDNKNKFKKPGMLISSFQISTVEIQWLTGLSQPTIDSLLKPVKIKTGKTMARLFKKIGLLAHTVGIEKIHGGYQFSLIDYTGHAKEHERHILEAVITKEFESILYKSADAPFIILPSPKDK